MIFKFVGRNGDQLFDDVHAWVNVDGFLGPCRVGNASFYNYNNVVLVIL